MARKTRFVYMHPKEALATLEWYAENGVDEAIADAPVNRFRIQESGAGNQGKQGIAQSSSPEPRIQNPESSSRPLNPALTASPSAAMTKARELADKAKTLQELKDAVLNFDGCALKKTAMNTVFADGNPAAKVMMIGEAPGAEEDKQGIPFCGLSGKLLDKMFATVGLTRENFYISNTLFWRPPGNRQPTPEELAICKPFVEKHIALIDPSLLILVGGTAVKGVLDVNTGITRMRGQRYSYKNQYIEKDIPVMVVFHPSYLLRQPAQKKQAWHDMLSIEAFLQDRGKRE